MLQTITNTTVSFIECSAGDLDVDIVSYNALLPCFAITDGNF